MKIRPPWSVNSRSAAASASICRSAASGRTSTLSSLSMMLVSAWPAAEVEEAAVVVHGLRVGEGLGLPAERVHALAHGLEEHLRSP